MIVGCDSFGACICHSLGVLFVLCTFGLTALGVGCVASFDEPSLWYTLGLGAFGAGGCFGLLLIGYACFAMRKQWKLFGCCGDHTDDSSNKSLGLRRKLEANNPYEMHINPRPNPHTSVIGMV